MSIWNKKTFKEESGLGKVVDIAESSNPLINIANRIQEHHQQKKEDYANNLGQIDSAITDAGNSPYDTAKVSSQSQNYYNLAQSGYRGAVEAAKTGFTAAQTNEANLNYQQSQNLALQNAAAVGGGQGNAYIGSAINSNNGKFNVDLAAASAREMDNKQARAAQYLQILGGATQPFDKANEQNFDKEILLQQQLRQDKQAAIANEIQRKRDNTATALAIFGDAAKIGAAAAGAPA